MIPFKNRFHGHSSLNFVYRNGQVTHGQSVSVRYILNPHRNQSRIAVVVGKKIVKSAVRRNLIRRRVYEYVSHRLLALGKVYDIVIIVKSSDFINMHHQEMTQQLDGVFNNTGVTDSR